VKATNEIITMRETAYAKQLEAEDRHRIGLIEPGVYERAHAFAEGVEAGLLWALGHAGSPF